MELLIAARRACRITLAVSLACLACAIGSARASALPGIGQLVRGPVLGLHVDLPCSNPANHGLVGRVLSAVSPSVGGPLRCFSQAIAHG
jgi:hypothetical protein